MSRKEGIFPSNFKRLTQGSAARSEMVQQNLEAWGSRRVKTQQQEGYPDPDLDVNNLSGDAPLSLLSRVASSKKGRGVVAGVAAVLGLGAVEHIVDAVKDPPPSVHRSIDRALGVQTAYAGDNPNYIPPENPPIVPPTGPGPKDPLPGLPNPGITPHPTPSPTPSPTPPPTPTPSPTPSPEGQLKVVKFHDRNADGQQDLGEEGLIWGFNVDGPGANDFRVQTQGDGTTIKTVQPGNYTVCEDDQQGWRATIAKCLSVFVPNGSRGETKFGNKQELPPPPTVTPTPSPTPSPTPTSLPEGQLKGVKYHDRNENGRQDLGEEGLIWGFNVDGPGANDFRMTTQGDGTVIRTVPVGQYQVCEDDKPGWRATVAKCLDVFVHPGQIVHTVFGNVQEKPKVVLTPTPSPTPTLEATPPPKKVAPPPPPRPEVKLPPLPILTPTPEIPKVCTLPSGEEVPLPPEFQAKLIGKDAQTIAKMMEEFKCELLGHVEQNTREHRDIREDIEVHDEKMTAQHGEQNVKLGEIKDAVGLGEGEMPIDEQIGVKPGEPSIAKRVDTLSEATGIDANGDGQTGFSDGSPSIKDRLTLIWDRVRDINGHDIWDRVDVGASIVAGVAGLAYLLDRGRRRGQPPAPQAPAAPAQPDGGQPQGPQPGRIRRALMGFPLIGGIFRPRQEQAPVAAAQQVPAPEAPAVPQQPEAPPAAPQPEQQQVEQENINALANIWLELIGALTDEQLQGVANRLTPERVNNLRVVLHRMGVENALALAPLAVVRVVRDTINAMPEDRRQVILQRAQEIAQQRAQAQQPAPTHQGAPEPEGQPVPEPQPVPAAEPEPQPEPAPEPVAAAPERGERVSFVINGTRRYIVAGRSRFTNAQGVEHLVLDFTPDRRVFRLRVGNRARRFDANRMQTLMAEHFQRGQA